MTDSPNAGILKGNGFPFTTESEQDIMLQVRYARYTPHDAYLRLTNEHYILDVDRRSGVLKGLYLTDDEQGTNFFGNEQNMRLNIWWKQRHVPEKARRIPMHCWTGDIVLKARLGGEEVWRAMHTFLSDDVRTVTYDDASITTRYEGNSVNRGGLQHLNIEQRYEFRGNPQSGDAIQWTITLENEGQAQMEIGELGLPITCLLYTSPSPRDRTRSRMPSSA